VLGWGGWWFWDPVENASFMPWLVGTALMHSLAVTEKRGGFKLWTVLLAIIAFSLSLLGTFLVRSGVLTSVHAFATDPKRGIFVLAFLALVIGAALALFAWRAPKVGLGGAFGLVSREAALLVNNVLLVAAAAAVLLGTLYPLFYEVLGYGKLSVGLPWFEIVFPVVMAPAVFLMGIGPLTRWKEDKLPELALRLKWAFGAAIVSAALVPVVMGRWSVLVALGILLATWVIAAGFVHLGDRVAHLRVSTGASPGAALQQLPRGYWGMLLAHFGVAVFIVGVTLVRGYEVEKHVRMSPGDTVTAGGYQFRLEGLKNVQGPNYEATRGIVSVTKNERPVTTLYPEKRLFTVQQMPMTEAAIDTGLTRDLYVSLGEALPDGAWVVRVYHKPFVDWIWGGAFLMALGGVIAVTDRRYRLARREGRSLVAASAAPAQGAG
jgi:cytochrome c-type biogenesis protein CcmF